MSTLYSQPARKPHRTRIDDVEAFVQEAQVIATKEKVSIADVIAAARVLEMRRANDLYAANGDAHDEQMAGIGEELQKVSSAIGAMNASE